MTNITASKPPPSFAPVYAAMYPELAKLARLHGYALAIHGSLQRDFDVVAIPWTAEAGTPEDLVTAIESEFAVIRAGGAPTAKPHGRVAYTLVIGFGECAVDLSFMPRV